jgi:hypothetical protein
LYGHALAGACMTKARANPDRTGSGQGPQVYFAACLGAVGHDAVTRARVGWESLTMREMVVRSERAPELATCQVKTVSRSVVLGNASERSTTTVRALPTGAKPIA